MSFINKDGRGGRGLVGVKREVKRRKAIIDVMHVSDTGKTDTGNAVGDTGKPVNNTGKPVNYGFIILPIGTFYNVNIETAKRGDVIRYADGIKRTIYDMCIVRIGSSVFRNLCRLRYGCEAVRVLNQWRRTAVSMGYAPDAIDGERAAVVFFKEDENADLFGRRIGKTA